MDLLLTGHFFELYVIRAPEPNITLKVNRQAGKARSEVRMKHFLTADLVGIFNRGRFVADIIR